jgi:hypothetical protein
MQSAGRTLPRTAKQNARKTGQPTNERKMLHCGYCLTDYKAICLSMRYFSNRGNTMTKKQGIWTDYDPENGKEGVRKSAGALNGVARAALKQDISDQRKRTVIAALHHTRDACCSSFSKSSRIHIRIKVVGPIPFFLARARTFASVSGSSRIVSPWERFLANLASTVSNSSW